MRSFKLTEGRLFVDIKRPAKKEAKKLYLENTGDLPVAENDQRAPRLFQEAKILHTSDETMYPVGSRWMIGETPGIVINFFGEKYIEIRESDLHAQIHD